MTAANQQVHRAGPTSDVRLDRSLIDASSGALRDSAGLGSQTPALTNKPARDGNAIPIGGNRSGAAHHRVLGDGSPVASHIIADRNSTRLNSSHLVNSY